MDDVEGHGSRSAIFRRRGRSSAMLPLGRRRLSRIRIPAGGWSTPAHDHGVEVELLYVLGGRGLSGTGARFEIGEGDCILFHRVRAAHAARAGRPGRSGLRPAGLRRERALPAARRIAVAATPKTLDGSTAGSPRSSCARPTSAHPLPVPSPRPPTMPTSARRHADGDCPAADPPNPPQPRQAVGSVTTGLQHVEVAPRMLSSPASRHSLEEEIFVVLGGDARFFSATRRSRCVSGHVVSRPLRHRRRAHVPRRRRGPHLPRPRHPRARRRLLSTSQVEQ